MTDQIFYIQWQLKWNQHIDGGGAIRGEETWILRYGRRRTVHSHFESL